MVIENRNIEYINQIDLKKYNTFHISKCIINTIDLIGVFELKPPLIIENCIINDFQIHSCWFVNGLILKNSIVNKDVDYQMGGHNIKPIEIEGNIFKGFLNFFDCQFRNTINLKHNVFAKGTNLLGNKGKGFENTFISGCFVEDNVGEIDVNEVVI